MRSKSVWLTGSILSLIVAMGTSSSRAGKTDGMITITKSFGEFFPIVSGGLSQVSVAIPDDYKIQKLPDDLAMNNFLWGRPSDTKAVTNDPSQVQFDKADQGVFRVRFTKNVTFDGTLKQFIDASGPVIQGLQAMGLSDLKTDSMMPKGIPVLIIQGKTSKGRVYMAYLQSPDDNLAVLVSLQSNHHHQKVDDQIWRTFVSALR